MAKLMLTGVVWLVSGSCFGGNCVRVGLLPNGDIAVGDTKNPDNAPQAFSPDEWDAFIEGVKAGTFDRAMLPTPSAP